MKYYLYVSPLLGDLEIWSEPIYTENGYARRYEYDGCIYYFSVDAPQQPGRFGHELIDEWVE